MKSTYPMKILQIGKFYPILGGVEKVMYDLMTGLASKGVACDMMCAAAEGAGGETRVGDHATLITCRTAFKASSTMLAPSMALKLRKICGQYDIIHIHHPDPMACAALFLSGYKGRVVLHWHSDILKNRALLSAYRPLQDWLVRRADRIVGTTPVYVRESPYLRGVQSKTTWIPIGVRPMRPDPQSVAGIRARYGHRKIIFSLGRLVSYKGYRFLIDAARYLDDSYIVLIGGSGPLRDSLQRQIDTTGLADKVKLLGFIPDEGLPSWFGACDLFCFSSIYKTEACGIAQIEAMSCGKPVVATDIPGSGVPWVNVHGYSGLNVPPGDSEALARAIKGIMVSDTAYRTYSVHAESRYKTMFTEDKMINDCIDLYEELLFRKPGIL